MKVRPSPIKILALVAALLGVTGAETVAAQAPACNTVANRVVVSGDSAMNAIWAAMAPALSTLAAPITIVANAGGSCYSILPFVGTQPDSAKWVYFDATGAQKPCTVAAGEVLPVDLGFGLDPHMCTTATLPANLGDYTGPVNTWTMIVPDGSAEQTISAQAMYYIYGFGAVNGNVAPWTNQSNIWGRARTSGTLVSVAFASHLSVDRMAANFLMADGTTPTAQQQSGEGALATKVGAATTSQTEMDATLGFVSATTAEPLRAGTAGVTNPVRTLAFQSWDQTCGYLPDSSATAHDKANVRDGHYDLWTNFHLVTLNQTSGANAGHPVSSSVETLINYVANAESAPAALNIPATLIGKAVIPLCAMHVQRAPGVLTPANGLGALMSVPADHNFCDGYYEFKTTGATSHAACTMTSDCAGKSVGGVPTPVCHLNYCEVQ